MDGVKVALCTHSAEYGTCDYCGADLGTAPGSGSSSVSSSSYSITLEESSNGSIAVSPARAEAGSTVTITVAPDSGYMMGNIIVLDQNGEEIELTAIGNGKYTFRMPRGKVEIKATFIEDDFMLNFFEDVPEGQYYYANSIAWAAKKGITSGIGGGLFGSNNDCTRAQIITLLYRSAK